MAYITYKPNRKGNLDIRTAEGKRGEIVKRRCTFKFVLTRDVSLHELQGISVFVGHLNG